MPDEVSMSMFASKEDYYKELIKRLEKKQEAKEKLAKFGAIIWKDCKNDNTGYPELSDEAYLFFYSLCKLPGIKEAVGELTK